MINVTIDPTRGRIFKLIRPLDHSVGTQTTYDYITPTLHLMVSEYESPPDLGQNWPRRFVVDYHLSMVEKRFGPGHTMKWRINLLENLHQETTAEEMQAFLNKINLRETERLMGIQQAD